MPDRTDIIVNVAVSLLVIALSIPLVYCSRGTALAACGTAPATVAPQSSVRRLLRVAREELEDIDTFCSARLRDTQQNQILFDPFCCTRAADNTPKPCKRFDRMFSIIVIPRHA